MVAWILRFVKIKNTALIFYLSYEYFTCGIYLRYIQFYF